MKNILEIVKENGEWEIFEREVRRNYNSKDIIKNHIANMEKFFQGIEIPENWRVEFDSDSMEFYGDLLLHLFIKNEINEYLFCFTIELDTLVERCDFTIHELMIYVDDYNISLGGDALESTNFSKLFKKYNELAKIFEEVGK
jgi:hypothetical protein